MASVAILLMAAYKLICAGTGSSESETGEQILQMHIC